MQTALIPGEKVVKSGRANMMRGLEAVGGNLHLTSHRLIFESHSFNVQSGASVIPRGEIISVSPVWTKVFGLLPLTPNSIEVATVAGAQQFVVAGRRAWIAALG